MARTALLPLVLLAACAPRRTLGATQPFTAADALAPAAGAGASSSNSASLAFASVFGHDMVLQRDAKAAVYGAALGSDAADHAHHFERHSRPTGMATQAAYQLRFFLARASCTGYAL